MLFVNYSKKKGPLVRPASMSAPTVAVAAAVAIAVAASSLLPLLLSPSIYTFAFNLFSRLFPSGQ